MKAVAAILILVSLILSGCQTSTAPRQAGDFMLEADEARIWERAREIVDLFHRSGHVIADRQLKDYLESICRRLYPEIDRHPSEFEVLVLRDPTVNAFVLPNGVVCVNSGLLAAMESEAQLAMVLSHEAAHFHLRHAVDGFRHLKAQAAFHTVFGVSTLGYGSLISMIGYPAAISGHSKEAEREADMLGWQWYIKAGYAKEEAQLAFEQLKRYAGKNPEKEPSFFGSHPRLQDRIEEMSRLAADSSVSQPKGGIVGVENLVEPLRGLWIVNALLDINLGNYDRVQLLIDRYGEHRLSRKDPDFYYAKAELNRRRGEDGAAAVVVKICEEGLTLDPHHPGLLRSIGQAYYQLGEWSLARERLVSAVTLDPEYSKNPFLYKYIEKCEEELNSL